jgi:hypothetical protein
MPKRIDTSDRYADDLIQPYFGMPSICLLFIRSAGRMPAENSTVHESPHFQPLFGSSWATKSIGSVKIDKLSWGSDW